ncbi:MAG: sulfotransferase [Pseudomonadota bacterium]
MRPVFVGGTGRSGTTVLKSILDCHPRVLGVPHEMRLIVDPGGALDLIDALSHRWSPYSADLAIHRFRDLCADLFSTPLTRSLPLRAARVALRRIGASAWRYHTVDASAFGSKAEFLAAVDRFLDTLIDHRTRGSWLGSRPFSPRSVIHETTPRRHADVAEAFGRFFDDVLSSRRGPCTHWVEDTPFNVSHPEELRAAFPQSKLIHIFRDPRDVVASHLTKAWGGDGAESVARRVRAVLERWLVLRETLPDDFYVELPLERIATAQRAELEALCGFLDLDYDSALERISLDKVNAGRWQSELNDAEQSAVIRVLGDTIQKYGY